MAKQEKKLTPWFEDQEPLYRGVYERNDAGTEMEDGEPNYAYWDGKHWAPSSISVEKAAHRNGWSAHQDLPWRGLARRPR